MVVDRSKLVTNLERFYNFANKTVLYVGAGGHQILRPETRPKKIFAIDSDPNSLERFRNDAETKWEGIPVEFVPKRFETVEIQRRRGLF